MQIDLHSYIDTVLEAYIAYILTMEYFFGRSDIDLKREEKRRQTKKSKGVESTSVSSGGDKTNVVLEPGAPGSPQTGKEG